MHTHRTAKGSPARAATMTMRDRSREEAVLLEGWAASDSVRSMDDPDWDDSQDRSDMACVALPRHAYDA